MSNFDSASECTRAFDNNPDISGVGVRISFYLQTVLLVLLVDRSWKDAPTALWSLIATSGGLQLAAIVQAKADNLSLFQALQVSNLVWLANFGTFVALASYSRQKAASRKKQNKKLEVLDYHVKYAAMLQTLLSMSLTLYMWVSAHTFGPEKECSVFLSYRLFVIKVPALTSGRIVGLTVSSLLTASYLVITVHELRASYHNSKSRGQSSKQAGSGDRSANSSPLLPITGRDVVSLPRSPAPVVRSPRVAAGTTTFREHAQSIVVSEPASFLSSPSTGTVRPSLAEYHRRPKRRRWSSDLDPMLVGIVICYVMVLTYFIVSTELLIAANPAGDDAVKEWGFGQILALIVVIPSALSAADAIKENGFRRLSTRKKSTLRPRRLMDQKHIRRGSPSEQEASASSPA
ncbi:hypothetical protein HGRIS_008231 [Hohenbuehelia grisea]|uniref:Uncharacterized protein n=1 Tax=Hohenbuehelia grisea TaxID=104357 RepID=A0ABR3J7V3_9AGAR